MFYAELWEQLTFRSMGRNEEENMWIVDAAVDRCRVTKKGWYIESVTSRCVQCNNYLGNKSTFTKCQIVSTIIVTSSLNLPPTLVRANEAVLIEDDNQKNLCYIHIKRWNMTVNLTSHR